MKTFMSFYPFTMHSTFGLIAVVLFLFCCCYNDGFQPNFRQNKIKYRNLSIISATTSKFSQANAFFEHVGSAIEGSSEKTTANLPCDVMFLPGLDGFGDYSLDAYSELSSQYRCWRLQIPPSDRSSFLKLAQMVIQKLQSFNSSSTVLIGESFGGVLASYVAYRLPEKVSRLILINPATSIADTPWRSVAPLIASTGPLYPAVGLSTLLASSIPPQQLFTAVKRFIQDVSSAPAGLSRNELFVKFSEEFEPLTILPAALPPDTLSWRLKEWLGTGNYLVKDILSSIRAPTLILIGKEDRLLPSSREGPRLKRLLGKSSFMVDLRVYPNKGHALLDKTFNLSSVLQDFQDKIKKKEARDISMEFPSQEDLMEIDKQLMPLFNAVSPVFLSTTEFGDIVEGLDPVPTGREGRPVLFVGNHQLLGLDMSLIIGQFLKEKQVLLRGLAHPILFNTSISPVETLELFEKFGAVEVSPVNYYRLLKQNETILLFPGGAKEALHSKGEEYKLFWPEKTDFVRMAGLLDAIIVPYAAVGMFESLRIVADRQDLEQFPWFKSFVEQSTQRFPSARWGETESIIPPIVTPKLPGRNYFLFTKPIDTRTFDAKNKTACREVYQEIRHNLQETIYSLREYSNQDPYKDFIPRLKRQKPFTKSLFTGKVGGGSSNDVSSAVPIPPVYLLEKSISNISNHQ